MVDEILKFSITLGGNSTYYYRGSSFYDSSGTATTIDGLSVNGNSVEIGSGLSGSLGTGTGELATITDYGYGYSLSVADEIKYGKNGTWTYNEYTGFNGSNLSAGYYVDANGVVKYSKASSQNITELKGFKLYNSGYSSYFHFDGMKIVVDDASIFNNKSVTLSTDNVYFDLQGTASIAAIAEGQWSIGSDSTTLWRIGEYYSSEGYATSNGKKTISTVAGGTSGANLFSITGFSYAYLTDLLGGSAASSSISGIAVQSRAGNNTTPEVTITDSNLLAKSGGSIVLTDVSSDDLVYSLRVDGDVKDMLKSDAASGTTTATWSAAGTSSYTYTSAYVSSPYATMDDNYTTLTYHNISDSSTITINGLSSNLFNNGTMSEAVTIDLMDDTFTVYLDDDALAGQNITADTKSSVVFNTDKILEDKMSDPEKGTQANQTELGGGKVNFTTAGIKQGYRNNVTEILYYPQDLSAYNFTISGLNQDLHDFYISDAGEIYAKLTENATDRTKIGSVVASVDNGKTTLNVSLSSAAINTNQSGFSGVVLNSSESVYFSLDIGGASMWDEASAPTFDTVDTADKYVYSAGYSEGFTKTSEAMGNLEYTYHGNSDADSFTLEGAAAGLSLGTNVLQYIELNQDNFSTYAATNSSGNGFVLQAGSYKLTSNISISAPIEITSNVVLDLAGYTLSKNTSTRSAAVYVLNDGNLTVNDSSGNNSGKIKNEVTSTSSDCGILVMPKNSNKTASLTVNGGTISGDEYGISGNGNKGYGKTYITINGGVIEATSSSDGHGIYNPQVGQLVINGGEIKGYSAGIEMRSGELYVTGGKITATATSSYGVSGNTNGTTTTGAAIAVSQHTTKNDISINITGGTFSGLVGLSIDDPQSGATDKVDVNITGGTFIGSQYSVVNGYSGITADLGGGSFYGALSIADTGVLNILTDDDGESYASFAGTSTGSASKIDSNSYDGIGTPVAEEPPEVAVPLLQSAGAIVINRKKVVVNQAGLSDGTFTFKSNYFTPDYGSDVVIIGSGSTPPISVEAYFQSGISDTDTSATYTTNLYSDYNMTIEGGLSHYDVQGGHSFTLGGISNINYTLNGGQSLADYVKVGYIAETVNTESTTDGHFQISGYSFIVREDLLKAIKQGGYLDLSLIGDNTDNISYTFGFISNADKDIRDTAVSASATIKYAGDGEFVYNASFSQKDYYQQAGTSRINHIEQIGGEPFTLSGDINPSLSKATLTVEDGVIKADGQSIGMVSVVAGESGISNGYVYLSDKFFAASGSTITLTDTTDDGIDYQLAAYSGANDYTYLNTYGNDNMTGMSFAESDGNYEYTSPYRRGGISLTVGSSSADNYITSLQYTEGGESHTFTIGGASNLATAIGSDSSIMLNYIEVNSYDDFLIDSDGYLQSSYYKVNSSFAVTKPLYTCDNTSVVIDVAENVSLSSSSNQYVIRMYGGNLTLQGKGNIVTESDYAVVLFPGRNDNSTNRNTQGTTVANLTVNGNIKITANGNGGAAISGNGTKNNTTDYSNTKITINGGTITGATGIYHPQAGVLVINGGNIIGTTESGIELRAGELYITSDDVTITSNATGDYVVKSNGNGGTTTGAAVAIAQHSTNQNISVNISGGTFEGIVGLSVDDPNGKATTVDINITGGTFKGSKYSVVNGYSGVTVDIGGGTFGGSVGSTLSADTSIFNIYADDSGKSFAKFASTSSAEASTVDVESASFSSFATSKQENLTPVDVPQLISAGGVVINGKVVTINQAGLSLLDFSSGSVGMSSAYYTFELGSDVSQLGSDSVPDIAHYGGFSDVANNATSAIYTTDLYSAYYTGLSSTDNYVNNYTITSYESTGGAQFLFGGLNGISVASGQSLADYVKSGYVGVSAATTLVDGQFTVTSYDFTIRKGLVENLQAGQSIYIAPQSGVDFQVVFDSLGFSSVYSKGDDAPLYNGSDASLSAAFALAGTSSYLYTAKITSLSRYGTLSSFMNDDPTTANIDESKAISIYHTKQVGGQKFSISGLYKTSGQEINIDDNGNIIRYTEKGSGSESSVTIGHIGDATIIGGVSTVYVTLTADAFNTTAGGLSTVVTLTDLDATDGVDFRLALGGLSSESAPYNGTFSPTNEMVDASAKAAYAYYSGGSTAYYIHGSTATVNNQFTTSITNIFKTGSNEQFYITGFVSGLSLGLDDNGSVTATDGTSIATIGTLSDNVLTLTNTDLLFTDLDPDSNPKASIKLSTYTGVSAYSLSIPENTNFGFSATYNDNTSFDEAEATLLSVNGESSTYIFHAKGYHPAYTYKDSDNHYVYYVEDWNKTATISGLRENLIGHISGIIDNEDLYPAITELGDFIDIDEGYVVLSSYEVLPETVTKDTVITLTKNEKSNISGLSVDTGVFYTSMSGFLSAADELETNKDDLLKAGSSIIHSVESSTYWSPVFRAIVDGEKLGGSSISFIRGEVGGDSFQFNGFSSALYFNLEDTATDFLGIYMSEESSDPELKISKVTFDETTGKIEGYTFTLSDSAAINFDKFRREGSGTLSITPLGSENVPVTLTFGEDLKSLLSAKTRQDVDWKEDNTYGTTWVYNASGSTEYFSPTSGTSSSYEYKPQTGGESFVVSGSVSYSSVTDYLSITEGVRKEDGSLSSITLTVGYSAIIDKESTSLKVQLMGIGNSVPVSVVMGEGYSGTINGTAFDYRSHEVAATLQPIVAGGNSYTFYAAGSTSGYYIENDENGIALRYTDTGKGRDSFNISGMSTGLSVASIAGGGYSILDATGNVVGSIGTSGWVEITSESAFSITEDQKTSTGSFIVTLTDTIVSDTSYNLKLGGGISTSATPYDAKLSQGSGSYVYTSAGTYGWYKQISNNKAFTYQAKTTDTTFNITNLRDNLGTVTINSGGEMKSTVGTIGTFNIDNKTFTFGASALPDTLASDSSIEITNNQYTLLLGEDVEKRTTSDESFKRVGSNVNNYTYTAKGSTSGFYRESNTVIKYGTLSGAQSFTIDGLSAGLQDHIAGDSSLGGDVTVSSGGSALNISESGVITVYKAALAGMSVSLTSTFGMSFKLSLAEDVTITENRDNTWTVEGGNGIFSSTWQTEGYSVAGNSMSIGYYSLSRVTDIELSGITDTTNFSVSGTSATLQASGFSDTVTVTKNSGAYAFYLSGALSNIDSATFTGTKEADTIFNYAMSLAIYGGDGVDFITNYASSVTINGGIGDDSIFNYGGSNVYLGGDSGSDTIYNGDNSSVGGASVTISGGDDNDFILNRGNYASINGGGGSNTITLLGGMGATVNVNEGSDTIVVDPASVTSFRVEGFSSGDDVISLASGSFTNLGEIDDGVTVNAGSSVVTIYGLNLYDPGDKWTLNGTTASYVPMTVAGVTLDNGNIVAEGKNTVGSAYLELTGIKSTVGFGVENNIATLQASGFSDTVTVTKNSGTNGAYAFYLSGALSDISTATFTGTDSADTIFNYAMSLSINTGAGKDTLYNYGDNVSIQNASGTARILNSGSSVTIQGSTSVDYITITGGSHISISAGDDTTNVIYNGINSTGGHGNYVTITGGTGQDKIRNYGSSVSINTANGNDSIYILGGNNVTIDSGEGDDTISVSEGASNVTINAGAGADKVTNKGSYVTIDGGEGNDTVSVVAGASYVSINAGAGADKVTNKGSYITIDGGEGNDTISNNTGGDYVFIVGGSGADKVTNYGSSVTIDGGEGDDYIVNLTGSHISIGGDSGADTIKNGNGQGTNGNAGSYVTMNGGIGDDLIYNYSGSHISINGGSGSNTIRLYGGTDVTVNVADGSNLIRLVTVTGVDTITSFRVEGFSTGLNADDTIILATAINTTLTTISGDGIQAGGVSIYGISKVYDVNNSWSTATSSVVYKQSTIAGASLGTDKKTITWVGSDSTADLFTITGIGESSFFEVNNANNVVSLSSTFGGLASGSSITISGDYTFSLGTLSEVQTGGGWSAVDGTATFATDWTIAGYSLSNDNKTVTFYDNVGDSAAKIELSGITSIDGFSVSGTNATLQASGFSTGGVSILKNAGNSYAFELSAGGYSGYSFTGLSTADTISVLGSSVAIYGASGTDFITNSGSYVTIGGGDDNDTISNSGSNVSINGGGDSNIISLTGGSYATVNVTDGDDTINVSASVTYFNVEGFSSGDVIQFATGTALSGLSAVGNDFTLMAGDHAVTIGGLSFSAEINGFSSYSDPKLVYTSETLAGALSSGNTLVYRGASSIDRFTITGISSTLGVVYEYLPTSDSKIVTLTADALSTVNPLTGGATINSGYTFSFDDNVTTVVGGESSAWDFKDNVAKLYSDKWNRAGYSLAGTSTSVSYVDASGTLKLELSGVSSISGVTVPTEDNKVVSLTPKNFTANGLSIVSNSGAFTFSLSGVFTFDTSLYGSEGSDTISVAAGTSNIGVYGQSGNDFLSVADGVTNVTLDGGKGDDFLVGGMSTAVFFIGGSGADTFSFGGGNDTIKDYHFSETDVIDFSTSLGDGFGIADITSLSSVGGNLVINFGDSMSLQLNGISSSDTVQLDSKLNGEYTYNFYGSTNEIFTADGTNLIVLNTASLSLGIDDDKYNSVKNVSLKGGGYVTASASGATMWSNKGDVTLTGGSGVDEFIYAGGSMTISSYTDGDDQIVLSDNYTIQGSPLLSGSADTISTNVTLTVANNDGDTGTVVLSDMNIGKNTTMITVKTDKDTEAIYLTDDRYNNPNNRTNATAVSVVGSADKVRDYGIQVDENMSIASGSSTLPEYYSALVSIKATEDTLSSFHLIGNAKANTFVIDGGQSNILTGGLGKDTFIFESSTIAGASFGTGGIITDFGAGGTKDGTGKAFATNVTSDDYDRNNPTSYAESNDVLKVNGTVVEVAFNSFKDTTVDSTKKSVFSVYVTYDPDGKDGDHLSGNEKTILLGNIVKPYYKKGQWKTDEAIAKTLKIWDTRNNGKSAILSSAVLSDMFRSTSTQSGGTSYIGNINELDALVSTKSASDGLEIIGLAKNSTIADGTDSIACNGIETLKKTTTP